MIRYLLLLLITIQNLSCQSNRKYESIESDKYSISYPSSMNVDNTGVSGADFVLSTAKKSENDVFIENINLMIQKSEDDLMDFANRTKSEIEKVGTIISSSVINNNEKSIYRIAFSLIQNGYQLKFIQHALIDNNVLYLLTYSSEASEFAEHSKEMEEIMLSFKLKSIN